MDQGSGAAGFITHQRYNRRATVVILCGTALLLLVAVSSLVGALGGYSRQACATPTSSYSDPYSSSPYSSSPYSSSPYSSPSYSEPSCSTEFIFRPQVLVGSLIAVALYLLIAYLGSAKAALALSRAVPADGPQYQELRDLVAQMAIAAGLPTPKVYVVMDPSPNAFATGRSPQNAAITVTTGLLFALSTRELRGVIAHEMAHIKNRDIAVMTLAVLAVGVIAVLSQVAIRVGAVTGRSRNSGNAGAALMLIGVVMYLLAVPAGLMLKAALSRRREALADATAIELTREPMGLRSALEKLEADNTPLQHASPAVAHLWIESPLERGHKTGLAGSLGRAFNTHPPLSDRIELLRGYEGLDPHGRGPNDPSRYPQAPPPPQAPNWPAPGGRPQPPPPPQ